jgi:hypothetical protein
VASSFSPPPIHPSRTLPLVGGASHNPRALRQTQRGECSGKRGPEKTPIRPPPLLPSNLIVAKKELREKTVSRQFRASVLGASSSLLLHPLSKARPLHFFFVCIYTGARDAFLLV